MGIGLAAFLLVGLGAGGWYVLESRREQRDLEEVGRLNQKMVRDHQPLSDADLDQALALCDSTHSEARMTGLNIAAAAVRGWGGHPPRPADTGRVTVAAVRLLTDRESRVRRQAAKVLGSLGAKDQLGAIRPLTQAVDPLEREAAEEAIRRLTPPAAE
jgi:hypothetical protein